MFTSDQEASAGSCMDELRSPVGKIKPAKVNSLVPLMIGHLTQDSLETLNLWGKPIQLVCLVAYIRKVENTATKITYDIVDETGSITALQLIDSTKPEELAIVPQGSYARIIGSPREQQNIRHVMIMRIDPVNSFAEIFRHGMEVSFVCLKAEEATKEKRITKANIEKKMEIDESQDMGPDEILIYKAIYAANDTKNGIDRMDLLLSLPKTMEGKFDTILDFLLSEGHIYGTCDDDHFKAV